MKLSQVYRSGQVIRWHQNPEMNRAMQTNADHQWGVAVIIMSEFPDDVSVRLLRAALLHDVGEVVVGDLPGPLKRDPRNTKLVELHTLAETYARNAMGIMLPRNRREAMILKYADTKEAYMTMLRHNPGLAARYDWQEQKARIRQMKEELDDK